jgi:r1t holin
MFNLVWLRDMAERVLATFIMAAGGVLVVSGWDSWKEALAAGGVAALGSLLKAVAGTQVGDPDSASVLPTREP